MLILDFLLLIMIGVCIAYCWMLNRRIQDLQNSRVEFARMIKELNVSIIKAEASVADLSELAKVTSSQLKISIEEATTHSNELKILTDLANTVSEELSSQIRAIKREQREAYASNFEDRAHTEDDSKYSSARTSKKIADRKQEQSTANLNERFSDEDLANDDETLSNKMPYKNHLKSFVTNIVTKKPEENLGSLNYYDTLRRISAKK